MVVSVVQVMSDLTSGGIFDPIVSVEVVSGDVALTVDPALEPSDEITVYLKPEPCRRLAVELVRLADQIDPPDKHLGCYSYPNCEDGPGGCRVLHGDDAEPYGHR